MNRLSRIALVLACCIVVAASGLVVSSFSPSEGIDVRVDGFVFEPGSSVALELAPAEGTARFGANVFVEQVELADAQGNLIAATMYDSFVDAEEWLGIMALRAYDGSDLPPGAYEIRVSTTAGTFTMGISVVRAAQFGGLDRFVAGVPVGDLALTAYRVVTELDDGQRVTLRDGDRLMVLLSGNPTTGYSWTSTKIYEYAVIRESEEMEYRANSNLIGAGGFFIFRYWATDTGTQDFHYAYERSWETVGPISTLTFSATVR